jgi:hypothetical protein
MCIFDKIPAVFQCLAKIIPILVTSASIATAAIPNPSEDTARALHLIHDVLDVVAINVNHNTPVGVPNAPSN